MFLLLYFIVSKATLIDIFKSNSSNSIIRPEVSEFQPLGINIQDSSKKLSQLKASEKLLRDSIKIYEEENNPIKVIVNVENKKIKNKKYLENTEEDYDGNFVTKQRSKKPSNEKKNSIKIDSIKEKILKKYFEKPEYENEKKGKNVLKNLQGTIKEKRSIEDQETTTINNSLNTKPEKNISKDSNEESSCEIEESSDSGMYTSLFSYNLDGEMIDGDSALIFFAKENWNVLNYIRYFKNIFIIPRQELSKLPVSYLLKRYISNIQGIDNLIKIDDKFDGFDYNSNNIKKMLEKNENTEDIVLCDYIPTLIEYFKRFAAENVKLFIKIEFLLTKLNDDLDRLLNIKKYNFNPHSKEIDELIHNLSDMQGIISEKFEEYYVKKKQIRNIICDSFNNQYGAVDDNLNIQNICLERNVCNERLKSNKNFDIKDNDHKLKDAKNNVINCLINEETKRYVPLVSINMEGFSNKTNIERIIKKCIMKKDNKNTDILVSNAQIYNDLLSSILPFVSEDVLVADLLYYESYIKSIIIDSITKLRICNKT